MWSELCLKLRNIQFTSSNLFNLTATINSIPFTRKGFYCLLFLYKGFIMEKMPYRFWWRKKFLTDITLPYGAKLVGLVLNHHMNNDT